MSDWILTLNAGTSSIKAAAYALAPGPPLARPAARVTLAGIGDRAALSVEAGGESREQPVEVAELDEAWALVLDRLEALTGEGRITAIGHRIVHGGAGFAEPVRITPAIEVELEALSPLAPLHQPFNLAGVAQARARWPEAPQIACFDTAFHRRQPEQAQLYALPREIREAGALRYGFHGLSYEFITARAADVIGARPERMIIAHLGAGASMCAVRDGRSVATTMGFTALAGLPMATRSGDVDPGLSLWLIEQRGFSAGEVSRLLNRRSGLLGLSGVSGDMRLLEASDAPEADLAIEHFIYRCGREIGSLAAALGGLDAIVFTAGIGEHSARVRAGVIEQMGWLGCRLDAAANSTGGPRLSAPDSRVSAWVIPTDEEAMIAAHAARFL